MKRTALKRKTPLKAKPHIPKLRQRKCACRCGAKFLPRNSLHVAASLECAIKLAELHRVKEAKEAKRRENVRDRARREKLKTLSQWLKEAQAAVNAWVRERDRHLPCISCGRFHRGAYDAGHYRSTGAAPELRFHLDNIHRQCVPCNQHKSGNAIEYRLGLVKRIGIERVEWLEGPHKPKKYAIAEVKAIRDDFRAKLRELKKASEDWQ